MQTLGLSESTPATDNRLKSLFWPAVNTAIDVDYLGTQGYWLCTVVAIIALLFLLMFGQWVFGLLYFAFYYVGAVGVRERNRYVALIIAVMCSAETLALLITLALNVMSMSFLMTAWTFLHVILTALLVANVRATWIASRWRAESENAVVPPRLSGTWGDKLADQWPMWFWPRIQLLYYIYSTGFVAMMAAFAWIFYTRFNPY